MSIVRLPTNFNIDLEFEIPEFHRRLLAWLLDVVLLFFYLKIALAIFQGFYGRLSYTQDEQHNLWSIDILIWLPVFLYHPVCEITMNGQSLGKKIMGLQVVNETGGRPAISQFLIRWLVRTADVMVFVIILYNVLIFLEPQLLWALIGSVILLFVDLGLVIMSRKAQRLGDILARTILIRTQAKGSIEETVFQEVADTYIPSYPQIMQLSDRDINAIKSILETARRKNDLRMAVAAAEKIKAHLKINSSLLSYDFLDILLKDYNYLSIK